MALAQGESHWWTPQEKITNRAMALRTAANRGNLPPATTAEIEAYAKKTGRTPAQVRQILMQNGVQIKD